MKKIKNNRGITIVSLIVTIIIMLILTAVVITSTDTGADYKRYKLMCADIELLEDKILVYYNKYGEIPTTGEMLTEGIPEAIINPNVEQEFYQLNINKLGNFTLNFGDEEDVFIIDYKTFEVYFLNGIEYEEEIYYTD